MGYFLDGEFDFVEDDEEYSKPVITSNNYYDFSLSDLEDIEDEELRTIALAAYYEVLNSIPKGLYIREGSSINYMIGKIMTFEAKNISPNNHHTVYIYPNCRRHISKKERVCTLCRETIYPGQAYLIWRPMFYDQTIKKTRILTTDIIVKEDCQHYLPQNIGEFEMMEHWLNYCSNMCCSTQIDDRHWFPNNHPMNGNEIKYEDFSNAIGGFHTYALERKKKIKKKKTTIR